MAELKTKTIFSQNHMANWQNKAIKIKSTFTKKTWQNGKIKLVMATRGFFGRAMADYNSLIYIYIYFFARYSANPPHAQYRGC